MANFLIQTSLYKGRAGYVKIWDLIKCHSRPVSSVIGPSQKLHIYYFKVWGRVEPFFLNQLWIADNKKLLLKQAFQQMPSVLYKAHGTEHLSETQLLDNIWFKTDAPVPAVLQTPDIFKLLTTEKIRPVTGEFLLLWTLRHCYWFLLYLEPAEQMASCHSGRESGAGHLKSQRRCLRLHKASPLGPAPPLWRGRQFFVF